MQTVRVRAAEDDDQSADLDVDLTHAVSGGDYNTVTASNVTVTIIENDVATLSAADVRASESVGDMVFTVTLSKASSNEVTVDYATSIGTAMAGADFTGQNGTLTFPASSTASQTIRVPITGDRVDEEEETFTMTLINVQGGALLAGGGSTLAVTGTIVDDDTRGVRMNRTALGLRKGGTGTYTVVLTSEPEATVTVTVGGASNGVTAAPTPLTFTTNDWEMAQTVTVTAAEEAPDGLVVLRHTVSGGDYGPVTAPNVTVRVSSTSQPPPPPPRDDETSGTVSSTPPPPQRTGGPTKVWVSFSAKSYSVVEGGSVGITLRLNKAAGRTVTIPLETANQNGTSDADYSGVPASVTFAANETKKSFQFAAGQDDDYDHGEQVAISFGELPGNVGMVPPSKATVNILDLPEVSVSFDRADYRVTEGDSVRVTVRLNADPQREVRIPLETTPGMGADESDYSGVPSRVLFAPHETEKSFFFRAVADQVDDGGETVAASFASLPSGVTAGNPATATATLFDAVSLSFDPVRYEGTEGQEAMEFTVALSTATYREVTVDYATSAGTATAGEDYKEVAGTLTFAAGTREQTLRVPILDDDEDEAHETFTVKLSAASHAAINVGEATGVIRDDDLPVLSISSFAGEDGTTIEDPRVTEGDTLRFTLTRVGDLSMPLQVPVKVTQEGAFLAGEPPTVVEFAADEGTATLEVKTEDDEVDEHDGSISAIIADGETSRIGETSIARVTVEDNDERGIRVAPTTLNVVEGETGTYEVELTSEPTAAVGVAVGVPDQAEVSVEPAELTFTPDNWRGTRTVTVTAAHDPDGMVDDPLTLTHAVSGGDYDDVTAAGVEVVVAEDDSQRVSVSAGKLTIEEGATASYTMGMDAEPTGTVTVTVEVPEGAELLVSPTVLTFTPDDWSQPQTVTVTALEDDDAVADDPVVLTHTASGPDQVDVSDAGVEVVVAEDDSQRVSVSAGELTIEEGATASYTVGMDAEPTGTVTVTVEVPEGAELLVSPTMLTFTPDNWSQPQTVTVTALEDDDAVADDPVVLIHTASGPDQVDVSDAGVEVSISEDDTQGVELSEQALTVAEGKTGTYSVVLTSKPTADVRLEVQVPEGAEISAAPTALTFTPENWRLPQTVTVTAAPDEDAMVDDPVVLIHTVSGGDYGGVYGGAIEVSIAETDTTIISIGGSSAAEGDGAMEFPVTLSMAASRAVTVEYATSAGSATAGVDYEETSGTLTFTPETTEQTIRVAILDDDVDEPAETFTIALSAAVNATIGSGQATGVILDDDLPVVEIAVEEGSVAEGSPAKFTLTRVGDLSAALQVALQVTQEGSFLIGDPPTEVTFAADEATATVTLATADDHIDEVDGSVSATVPGGETYRAGAAATATATVIDNDERGITIIPTTLTVAEGKTGEYTVLLNTEPTAEVRVMVEGPASSEVSAEPTELTFTAQNWSTAQTVTVSADQDDDAVADSAITLNHEVSGGDYQGIAAPTVEVSITEDDAPAVSVSVETLTVDEGETGEYTVALNTEPAGEVTVKVLVPEETDLTTSPSALTFTTRNWSTAQTVTVSAGQDDDAVADSAITLNHEVSGGDYQGIVASTVEVSITEDDAPAVSVSVETLTVDEGETGQYTVALNTEPAAEVTVKVLVPEETDLTTSPSALTFTTRNWSTAQTVTVSADQDDDAVADSAITLNHQISGGDYQGIIASTVEVSITEDDAPAVSVSVETLTVAEGETGEYTVALNTEPAGEVTVKVIVPEETDLTASPSALTFTTRNWSTAQTVTVSADQDDDAVADSAITLNHEVSGGDYQGVAAPAVQVSITEDDTPGVKVSVETLTVTEGGEGSYSLALDTEPAGEVSVEIIVPVEAEVSVDPEELTFTEDNWSSAQTVKVSAAEDEDAVEDGPVTLKHQVSGGDYEGVTAAAVVVSVGEDDRPALTIADTTAAEGAGTMVFTVALSVASSLEVTVDWATADHTATKGSDYEEGTGTLRFRPLETEQTIAVTLLDDVLDEADETFTVSLSNPSNATVARGAARGRISDDDVSPVLTIADAEASEGEGTMAFTVSLGAASSLEVGVGWETSDGTAKAGKDYTAATGVLTFAPGEREQTIAVALFNDALDEADETFTVSLRNPSNASMTAGTAIGRILDNDVSLEKAWLARFGRTTASQVMDAVADRLRQSSGGNGHLTLGGQRVMLGSGGEAGPLHGRTADRGLPAFDVSFPDVRSSHSFPARRRNSFAGVLSRSSFLVSPGEDADSTGRDYAWTAWGRGVTTRFSHESRDLSLKGAAVTSLIGIDRRRGRLLAGLVMAHNLVTGEFDMRSAEEAARKDDLDNHLASMHPFVSFAMSERLSAWGVLGYGRGRMGPSTGRTSRSIAMRMGGLGFRGTPWAPGRMGSLDLALKSDAFWVQMDAGATERPAVTASSSRVRLALEAVRPVALEGGQVLYPALELGLRHDGGDAETGRGIELGGGLGYSDPDQGLTLQTNARRLLVHRDDGYEEWGVEGSFTFYPGAFERGMSLRLQSSWGAAPSGQDRLWGPQGAHLAPGGDGGESAVFNAELGYGLEALGALLTPYANLGLADHGTRTCSLGWRLRIEPLLRLEISADRRQYARARPVHEISMRGTMDW